MQTVFYEDHNLVQQPRHDLIITSFDCLTLKLNQKTVERVIDTMQRTNWSNGWRSCFHYLRCFIKLLNDDSE